MIATTTNSLLDQVLEACGGLDRWCAVQEIIVTGQLGGLLLNLHTEFEDDPVRVIRIHPKKTALSVTDYPCEGCIGYWTGNIVRIETTSGRVLRARHNPRRYFLRYPPRLRRLLYWDTLDVLYFTGYAVWNYFLTPFLFTFPGVQPTEIEPDEAGRRRLRVRFPESLHTHCPEQVFTFDHDGLLTSLQYTADILGRWAQIYHSIDEHVCFDGLVFGVRRRASLEDVDVFLRRFPRVQQLRQRLLPHSFAMWGDIHRIDVIT